MARVAGIKNKATIIKSDSEDRFLADCLERYTYWKAMAAKIKEEGGSGAREIEYAEYFKIGVNKFSNIEG